MNNKWSIATVWNETLQEERKEIKERNHINASDLGSPFLDRYYKMKGIQPSNLYDSRVLRIFAAGNEFHHLLQKVFEKIGILIDKEQRVEIPENENHLKIVGYYDMKLGGITNWNEATLRIKNYGFSSFVEQIALKLINNLEFKHSEGLKSLITEIKSINSNAFWSKKDYIGIGYPHHRLQLYTYLKATNLDEGRLLYISKDDLSLQEGIVLNPTIQLEKDWNKDIETMTKYYRNNEIPPKEDDVAFNPIKKRYETNWRILRSPYLTKITGLTIEKWLENTKTQVSLKNKELKDKLKVKNYEPKRNKI